MKQQTNVTEIENLHPSIIILSLGFNHHPLSSSEIYQEFNKQKSCHFTGMGNNLSKKQSRNFINIILTSFWDW